MRARACVYTCVFACARVHVCVCVRVVRVWGHTVGLVLPAQGGGGHEVGEARVGGRLLGNREGDRLARIPKHMSSST